MDDMPLAQVVKEDWETVPRIGSKRACGAVERESRRSVRTEQYLLLLAID